MYNILKHVDEVFEVLNRRGFQYEIPQRVFVAEIKRATSVFSETTINRWMKTFKELGYIRTKGAGVLERCIDFNNPYVFHDGADYEGTGDQSVISEEKKEDIKK